MSNMKTLIENAPTILNAASKLNNLTESGEGSLIEFASPTRNVIMATVEDKLTHYDVTEDILKFSMNLYTAYYLQAVALLQTIDDVNVRETLDRLNTNRDFGQNLKNFNQEKWKKEWIGKESYLNDPLLYPDFQQYNPNTSLECYIPHDAKVALEASAEDTVILENGGTVNNQTDVNVEIKDKASSAKADANTTKLAADEPNLACGRLFEVVISGSNGRKAVIPAFIQINPIRTNKQMFIAMYAQTNLNETYVNRFRRWLDGELTTIGDMIMMNDMVNNYAKLIRMDKNKIVENLEKKRRQNHLSTLATGKTSLATASTISVISSKTIAELEVAMGARITNEKARNMIFDRSSLMMMCIVDEMYEMVTIYHRKQSAKMELTFKQCKQSSRGNGPDVMEILRAFQAGQAPNF